MKLKNNSNQEKDMKNTNNNQKNEETWCKSQKSRDEIENHNQQRIQVKCIEIKIMMT
jgi:hypothetical protein